MITFAHDMVNAHTGAPIHDRANFLEMADAVQEVRRELVGSRMVQETERL
ncbi:MAG: hypothetical protein GWN58_28510, partial [Anaerolineae bacterium]|nr:hypothetical protein [Anaerolineae bacterium]